MFSESPSFDKLELSVMTIWSDVNILKKVCDAGFGIFMVKFDLDINLILPSNFRFKTFA